MRQLRMSDGEIDGVEGSSRASLHRAQTEWADHSPDVAHCGGV